MNVRLTPQQEEFVKRQVAEGRYLSEAEVIREGLRLLAEETDWRAEVRKKIAEGLAQAERGEFVDGEEVFAELRRKSQERRGSKE